MAQKEERKVVCVHCRKSFKEGFVRDKNWPIQSRLSEHFKEMSLLTRCEECNPPLTTKIVDLKVKKEPISKVEVAGMMNRETFFSLMDEWVAGHKEQIKEFLEEVLYANKN